MGQIPCGNGARRRLWQVTLAIFLVACAVLAIPRQAHATESLKITGTANYDYAQQAVDLANTERRNNGLGNLNFDPGLAEKAMQRAAETAVYWSHTRPDGSRGMDIVQGPRGENIAAGTRLPLPW